MLFLKTLTDIYFLLQQKKLTQNQNQLLEYHSAIHLKVKMLFQARMMITGSQKKQRMNHQGKVLQKLQRNSKR